MGHVLAPGEAAAGGRSSGGRSRAGFMAVLVTLPEEHLSGYDLVLMYYCACAPCSRGDRTMRLHSARSGGEKVPVEFIQGCGCGGETSVGWQGMGCPHIISEFINAFLALTATTSGL